MFYVWYDVMVLYLCFVIVFVGKGFLFFGCCVQFVDEFDCIFELWFEDEGFIVWECFCEICLEEQYNEDEVVESVVNDFVFSVWFFEYLDQGVLFVLVVGVKL